MTTVYSTYDAKARFSEVIRRVRDGETITVSYRGEPVAEIRPIRKTKQTQQERLEELERRGELVRASEPWRPFEIGKPSPGALDRFLTDRDA